MSEKQLNQFIEDNSPEIDMELDQEDIDLLKGE
jgi:hypothetical protein